MHEWLEGLQKSAKRTVTGVEPEEIRRAETECGVPFPEELGALYRAFNGGELQGDVTLFPLHGPEGAPSVLEKTRLKLESLPAAGVWRIGVKGPHRQLFAARKSAMVEQADSPLPGWAEPLSGDDWIYGTWETEARELRLYRSLPAMLEVLVPPAEVEEFGDRTYARALSAVQGALSDLSVEYEEGETPASASAEEEESEEEAEGEVEVEGEERVEEGEGSGTPTREELRQLVVAAAQRRVERLRQPAGGEQVSPVALAQEVTELAAAGARKAAKKAAAAVTGAALKVADRALTATGVKDAVKKATSEAKPAAKAPAKKAAAKQAPATKAAAKAPAKKAAAKKAAAKKAPAKKAAAKKAPAKKAAAKAPAKKTAAKKAPAKKATGAKTASKKGAARGRR